MLTYYYGFDHKDKFEQLFGKLAIGKKPTLLANRYLILTFDFSGILTDTPKTTQEGFLFNVQQSVEAFLNDYVDFFPNLDFSTILNQNSANKIVGKLFQAHRNYKVPYPIYILIDEYDHFAN